MSNIISLIIIVAEQDAALTRELDEQLTILRPGLSSWHLYGDDILAGDEWFSMIQKKAAEAHILMPMFSQHFWNDPLCLSLLEKGLEREERGAALVLPLLLRPSLYDTRFEDRCRLLLPDGRAVTQQADLDATWHRIAAFLQRLTLALRPARAQPEETGPYTLVLQHPGRAQWPVLADELITHLSLPVETAGRALRRAPTVLREGLSAATAIDLWRRLSEVGAVVSVESPPGVPALPRLRVSTTGLVLAAIPAAPTPHGGGAGGQVAINPFLLLQGPVSWALYQRVTGFCGGRDERCPAEGVSFDESLEFCARLTALEGADPPYRLPTSTEWEHAARAQDGTRYAGSDTWREVAWARVGSAQPIGTRSANGWGLYDMSGNVWEWVQDPAEADETMRVVRGGCYASSPEELCVSARCSVARGSRDRIGLRVARSIT